VSSYEIVIELAGPTIDAVQECELVLRSLPGWFGIEASLVEYARATKELPTFVARHQGKVVGFVSLRRHFEHAWEVHCIAVAAPHRNHGIGRALLRQAEGWLGEKGARTLQVKTLADSHPSAEYAESREFYQRLGFEALEIFPALWSPHLPVLLLVKILVS
jgi:ribosomal protein S18 acetylase RimI-like enzyme